MITEKLEHSTMSTEKKSKYAKLSDTAIARLEPYRDLMGKRPDGEIAKLAGMDRRYVVVFRTHNDIPPYRRGSASTSSKPADGSKPRRFRKSRLDEFRHLMGEVPDGRIAELASCSREAVMRYRKRYEIASASRSRKPEPIANATIEPVATIESPAAPAVVPTPVEPIDDLPPEADELIEQQAIGTRVPAEEPDPTLEGYVLTVRIEGQDEQWMVLGHDLSQAAHSALARVTEQMPEAKIIELRYCADLL
jgi:hypothetical protein